MATWKTVEELASALPETEATTSYGTPAFKVKGKGFLRLREEGDSVVAYTEEKEHLLRSNPEIYFTTSHSDGHPLVLVQLSRISKKELREVITDAWRMRAPAKVRKDHPEI